MGTGAQASNTRRLHWYRGSQDKGQTPCDKGTNRVTWTDQEEVWNAPENAARRCRECLKAQK